LKKSLLKRSSYWERGKNPTVEKKKRKLQPTGARFTNPRTPFLKGDTGGRKEP